MISVKDLESFPKLLDISNNSKSLLVDRSSVHEFSRGDDLICQGDEVGGAYFVVRGAIRVYSINTEGRESTLYEVLPGESCILAINCLFSRVKYPAWVSCISDSTEILVIPPDVYRTLHDKEKSIKDATLEILSQRIFDLMSTLEIALSYSLEQRVASLILRRSDSDNRVRITHQEIASELGSIREVISRILKNLEKKKSIRLSRGLIEIVSIDGLRSFTNG